MLGPCRVGCYYVADAVQAVSAFLLRCYGITFVPLAVYGVGLWGLGFFGRCKLTNEGLAGYESIHTTKGPVASAIAVAPMAGSLLVLLWRTVRTKSLVGQNACF